MLDAVGTPRLTRARRLALLGAVLLVVAGLFGLTAARSWLAETPQPDRAPQDFAAGVTLPDVQLLDGAGMPASLAELHGNPLLLFFGYTSCPDFCPLTLGAFAEVKQRLGPQADFAYFVFVSIDGTRDTSARVAAYVARFDAAIVGLTGHPDDVRRLGEPLGLWFESRAGEGALGYTIDHTTDMYLVGADGTPKRSYPFGTAPEVLVDELRALINGE